MIWVRSGNFGQILGSGKLEFFKSQFKGRQFYFTKKKNDSNIQIFNFDFSSVINQGTRELIHSNQIIRHHISLVKLVSEYTKVSLIII
jgi:hypothetical protein